MTMRGLGTVFRKGFYRSRSGLILGVCRGIAEYFDFSVFWTRVITFMIFLFSGFWPVVVLYFVAALVMKPEPVIPIQDEEHQEFYDSYEMTHQFIKRLKKRYDEEGITIPFNMVTLDIPDNPRFTVNLDKT